MLSNGAPLPNSRYMIAIAVIASSPNWLIVIETVASTIVSAATAKREVRLNGEARDRAG